MAGDEKEKKSRDPIFTMCLVIFVIAAVAVTAVYVYDTFIQEDDRVATVGDVVYVNYTGTYNAFIGEDGAVVFDTSYKSVAEDDDYVKANEFTEKSEYTTFEVTIGSDKALSMFEDAIVGLKIGDKIKVKIPAEEAYVGGGWFQTSNLADQTVKVTETMTSKQFEDLYSLELDAGVSTAFTSTYGWNAWALLDSSTNMVTVTNMPELKSYVYTDPDKEAEEPAVKTTHTVTSIENGIITFTYSFEGKIDKFVSLDYGFYSIYVTSYDKSTFTFKTSDEKNNEDLYFEIVLESFKEKD